MEIMSKKNDSDYIDIDTIKRLIISKRNDKNSSKSAMIDRMINLAERKQFSMKIDDKYLSFFQNEYWGKMLYSTKSKLELHINEYSDTIISQ